MNLIIGYFLILSHHLAKLCQAV